MKLKPGHIYTLSAIHSENCMDKHKWVSLDTVAVGTGTNLRIVRDWTQELYNMGLISILRRRSIHYDWRENRVRLLKAGHDVVDAIRGCW